MRTLRHAADLLAAAAQHEGRHDLANALGFTQPSQRLDEDTRRRLGLPHDLEELHLVQGRGALRALLFHAPDQASLRTAFIRVASALTARTSYVLWLLIGAAHDGKEVGVACWSMTPRGPRLSALVARTERVVGSDADTLLSMASAGEGPDDLMVHARWCELLGREALSRRFYRTLEQKVRALGASLPRGAPADRAELALLCASRLLFLSFLESKGWLDGDHAFLASQFDACMQRGGQFHRRVLLPLFFGTLNTPIRHRAKRARAFGAVPFLNGGLFTRTPLEGRHRTSHFTDDALGALFGELLCAYRFTAREDAEDFTEAAVDPEMLGRAFESLMSSGERRNTGAFYTPQALVSSTVEHALAIALSCPGLSSDVIAAALRQSQDAVHPVSPGAAGRALLPEREAMLLRARIARFTVLDPACGSGAFLVHVLERLTLLTRIAGDARDTALIRRELLARAIHGVDVNPTAVWLCELRLWLAVVIESAETRMSAVPPLPNLDCNVRVGDALSGDAFREPPSLVGPPAALVRLRDRYVRATGPRKAPLRRAISREERRRAIAALERELTSLNDVRRERVRALRAGDLFGERSRAGSAVAAEMRAGRSKAAALRREIRRIADGGALPFSFPSHFGAVHARGGFDLVIGNPPWVRLHNIAPAARASLRARFAVFREPAWEPQRRDDVEHRGFAAQVDLASLFAERSLELVAPGGALALLLPAKLWRSLSGGGLRRLILARSELRRLEDWSDAPSVFDAAVYPSVLVASRGGSGSDARCDAGSAETSRGTDSGRQSRDEARRRMSRPPQGVSTSAGATWARDPDLTISLAVHRRTLALEWSAPCAALPLVIGDPASPWILMPADARRAFDRLRARGVALGTSAFGNATLGVKCGCNDAFVVDAIAEHGELVQVAAQGREGRVERQLLRPLLRGDALTPWSIAASHSAIVWTHAVPGGPLRVLPSGAARWLAPWRRQLGSRTDLRGGSTWWMLFRTDGADPRRPRVVWSDFGRVPRAAVLPAGDVTVPLNSCYVLPCNDLTDALALTTLLNSPVAAAFLNAIAEPARGNWRRYLAWTVALLPIPFDWPRARSLLASIAEAALVGRLPSNEELVEVAAKAYRLRVSDVAPLLAWSHIPVR